MIRRMNLSLGQQYNYLKTVNTKNVSCIDIETRWLTGKN